MLQIYTDEEMAIAYDLYEYVVFKVGEDDCMTDEDLPVFDLFCLSNEEYNDHLADLGILVYCGYYEEHTTDEELWFSEYYQDLEDQGVGKSIK
jgi:hypothetical protein